MIHGNLQITRLTLNRVEIKNLKTGRIFYLTSDNADIHVTALVRELLDIDYDLDSDTMPISDLSELETGTKSA